MTRVFSAKQQNGGTKLLILGASHYPHAHVAKPKVPKLEDISSAATSAIDFATHALTKWKNLFIKPIASVDLLVNDAANPDGVNFSCAGVDEIKVQAPTMDNILAARSSWLANADPNDTLIFYCCGHGIWLPSNSRTFLASDFGVDDESVWPKAIALDDFALGLTDKAPRNQWLLFDCCANTPPSALRSAKPAANPLIEPTNGMRAAMIKQYGPPVQATIAAASVGEQAFGRAGGRSRFMDVFIEACEDAGFREQADDGRWMLTLQGLDSSMSTYRFRVASLADRPYYTFSRLTTTDATEPPRLMARDQPASCTLLVTSEPAAKLKTCDLGIYLGTEKIAGQYGQGATELFRSVVTSFEMYKIHAGWPPEAPTIQSRRALPPLTEVKF